MTWKTKTFKLLHNPDTNCQNWSECDPKQSDSWAHVNMQHHMHAWMTSDSHSSKIKRCLKPVLMRYKKSHSEPKSTSLCIGEKCLTLRSSIKYSITQTSNLDQFCCKPGSASAARINSVKLSINWEATIQQVHFFFTAHIPAVLPPPAQMLLLLIILFCLVAWDFDVCVGMFESIQASR